MRLSRIKVQGRKAVYHCISRVVGGEMLLDDLGKQKLIALLWRLADFCGLEVITYCMMSNHFHLLLRVPEQNEPDDAQLLKRMEGLYGRKGGVVLLARQSIKEQGHIAPDLRKSMLERMGDVSEFMKELKQRFSRWYNRRMGRFGTLWAERFRSVLVEDQPGALSVVAAYIDLNPVRAGLVTDPKEYRFCGYGKALGGSRRAQAGLLTFYPKMEWAQAATEYRKRLYVSGGAAGQSGKAVLSREAIKKVLEQKGELSQGEVLRLRIRHMTDGVILGSKGFVNEMFLLYRERFGKRRKDGARPIRGAPQIGLSSMRDLRVAAVT